MKHLANEAQNKCSANVVCTLSNEKEHAFKPPTLATLEVIQTDDTDKTGQTTGNEQKKLEHESELKDHKKTKVGM